MISKVCFFINIFIKKSAQVQHSMSVIPFPTDELFYSPTDIIYSPTDFTDLHRCFSPDHWIIHPRNLNGI